MSNDPVATEKEALILSLLIARGEMYGLELVEESGGTIKPGTVYTTLSRMLSKRYVSSRMTEDDAGRPLRLYRAEGLGEQAFHAWRRSMFKAMERLAWSS